MAVTTTEVVTAIQRAPAVLQKAADYSQAVARIAPDTVRAINVLQPLLPLGPQLAVLAQHVNANAAAILRVAPQYAPALKNAANVLARAPALAEDIAAATGVAAGIAGRIGNDPALAPFVARVITLIDLAGGAGRASSDAASGAPAAAGVGLAKVVPWLDRGIAVLRHPWLLALPVVAVIGVSAGIGYAVGRRAQG